MLFDKVSLAAYWNNCMLCVITGKIPANSDLDCDFNELTDS